MRRLIKKCSVLTDYTLTLDLNGVDNLISNVIFEEFGVKYNITGQFSFSGEFLPEDYDEINSKISSLSNKEDIIKFINYYASVDINSKINSIANNYYIPEWELPTTKKVTAWYKPLPLKLKDIFIKSIELKDNFFDITFSIESESDITEYSSLGKENEEFKVYDIDPNNFNFSKEIMTGKFYR